MAFTTLLDATRRHTPTPLWKKIAVRVVFLIAVLGTAITFYGLVLGAFAAIVVAGSWMFVDGVRRGDPLTIMWAAVFVLFSGTGVVSMIWIIRLSLPW